MIYFVLLDAFFVCSHNFFKESLILDLGVFIYLYSHLRIHILCSSIISHDFNTLSYIDIDECASGSNPCTLANEECENTVGSYQCVCAADFVRTRGFCLSKFLIMANSFLLMSLLSVLLSVVSSVQYMVIWKCLSFILWAAHFFLEAKNL